LWIVARGFEEKLLNGILSLNGSPVSPYLEKEVFMKNPRQSCPMSSSDIKGFDLCGPLRLITRSQYCH